MRQSTTAADRKELRDNLRYKAFYDASLEFVAILLLV